MRVLFVVPYIPSLVRVRPYNLIRALTAAGHKLHLVLLQPPEDRDASADELRGVVDAIDVFKLSRWRTLANAAWAVPAGVPLQAAYSQHPEATRHIRALIQSSRYDVIHVEHLRGVMLMEGIAGLPRVFDSVDSISHLFDQARKYAPRLTQRLLARLDLERTRRFEGRLPARFERTLVTSPVDRQAFERLGGPAVAERISVLPNGVDLDYFRPSVDHEPATVLFSGKLSYHANASAASFLVREILPRIWEKRPETQVILAGKDPPAYLAALASDTRVTVTGAVADLRPFFARATLAAAPLLYGAGVQNKVLEAMASGLPVVASARVLEALQAEPGQHLLIGANADEMADQILAVIKQPALRKSLSQAGRDYVERHHDWAVVAQDLARIYEQVQLAAPPEPSGKRSVVDGRPFK